MLILLKLEVPKHSEFFFQLFSDLCPRTLGTHDTFKTLCSWIISISLFIFSISFFVTDDVVVTGILTAKWSPDLKDVRCDLDPVLLANNVRLVSGIYYFLLSDTYGEMVIGEPLYTNFFC